MEIPFDLFLEMIHCHASRGNSDKCLEFFDSALIHIGDGTANQLILYTRKNA